MSLCLYERRTDCNPALQVVKRAAGTCTFEKRRTDDRPAVAVPDDGVRFAAAFKREQLFGKLSASGAAG
jgi:hypothetical protein